MIKSLLLVALGGAIGSVFRFLTNINVAKFCPNKPFFATFFVNIIGCLIIGLLFGYFQKSQETNNALKLLLITGFCGGFTTFSAFGLENFNLIQSQNYSTFLFYLMASIFTGVTFVGLGIYLSNKIC